MNGLCVVETTYIRTPYVSRSAVDIDFERALGESESGGVSGIELRSD